MKLKPITIVNAKYSKYSQNTAQQIFLLKALKVTNDPKKLAQMIGVKKVADVYRTLDKMVLRKEFHKALYDSGIDFGYIVNGLKIEAATAEKSADRIKVYQTLLKSLGMDKYDDVGDGGSQWEDTLVKKMEQDKKDKLENKDKPKEISSGVEEYEVVMPEVPESVRARQKEEGDIGKSIYG